MKKKMTLGEEITFRMRCNIGQIEASEWKPKVEILKRPMRKKDEDRS